MSGEPIGKYTVVSTLGKGAHSTIFHIRRSADAKQYALKVVTIEGKDDQKYLDQLQHEFKVGQMFDHPHLLRVLTLETETDWLFRVRKANLLLEFINGKTLDRVEGLTLGHLLQIFVRVASGLVHMHKKGVLHADLKPNNIMLGRNGAVKILDFGLAWIKGHSKGRIQGTPEYIAPETAKLKVVNERTDIYNFGATMYRMVTGHLPPTVMAVEGQLPIDAGNFLRLLKPVKECNPKAPKPLCEIIERCLAFKPEQRPERISEVQGILDHLTDVLVPKSSDKLEAMEPEW